VYHPALAPVLPAVQAFCSAILRAQTPRRWLSLLGPSGIGKTFILRQALACLRRAHETGHWSLPTPTGRRGPQMAHLIPAEDLQDWAAPRAYARHDVLYIEDIGSGADTDAGAGRVLRNRILELLQLRSGRWTFLCANQHRAQLAESLDHRTASRLQRDGSVCLELPAEVPDFWG
jgi:DNA replication protein DnaC